jgi:EpsI family protein
MDVDEDVMVGRAAIVALVVCTGGLYARGAGSRDVPVPHAPLAGIPCAIGDWRCAGDSPLDRESLDVLRVDDYINRTYLDPRGGPAALFVGYYASQRQGDTIHSPLNCLPGSGWEPIDSASIDLGQEGVHLPANEVVVQKGLDRQVVVYWYQGRGRRIAGDYANKAWLILDAMRLHRSDGGLVRIVAPTASAAERFALALTPRLSAYLP